MDINFALPYRLKLEDQLALMTEDERQRADREILALIEERGVGRGSTEARVLAVERRREFVAAAEPLLQSRLTMNLVAAGVAAKYESKMPRREQRVWARVQDAAEDQAVVPLSAADAAWLASVFVEPPKRKGEDGDLTKVWDSYGPGHARFLDAFEDELRRVDRALRGDEGKAGRDD